MERVLILNDPDIEALAEMDELIEVLKSYFRAGADGRIIAPPRHAVTFGDSGRLVFTIGGAQGAQGFAGFRVYDTFGADDAALAQLVAVWNLESGELDGIFLGSALGALRTGAIGGVAVDLLARPDARQCGIIGSGPQAETQLRGVIAARPAMECIYVFSRTAEKRESFAHRMSAAISRRVIAVTSARQAVEGADVLVCATNSKTPVLETAWLSPGVHINTVGSRLAGAHELPVELGHCVALCATDSLAQLRALPEAHFLDGTPAGQNMIALSQLAASQGPARASDDITLFCSVGVAGSEIAVGAALLKKYRHCLPGRTASAQRGSADSKLC